MGVAQLEQLTSTQPQTATRQEIDCDLVIVGAGIVGATLACALKDSGLNIVLIDLQPKSVAVSRERAYALSLRSGQIFQQIGVWNQILPQIATFKQIRLSDGDSASVVQFQLADLGTDALGYVGEHRVLLTVLQEALDKSATIRWLCPGEVVATEYEADTVKIEVEVAGERKTLRSRLLVAADGGRSPLRAAANIGTRGWKYWQSCVTTTIKPKTPHNNIAFESFWPSGPMGVLPLPGNRYQIVWSAPHTKARELKELDEKEFLARLEYRIGSQLGSLELVAPRLVFPVRLMQSDRYVKPRLALIGDAAHCCHPVGGQGLNLGIRDAAALAQVLQTADRQGEDIGNPGVLKRYENWRKPENLVILGFTDFLNRLFSSTWIPVVVMRRLGIWMLGRVYPLRHLALRLMTGLSGRSQVKS